MSDIIDLPIRTLSFLTGDGDNTYGWEEKDDAWVIPMIQKKMDEGYVFWIVKRNPVREVRLRTAQEAKDTRNILIKDDVARMLFEQGRIGIVSAGTHVGPEREMVRERRAENAAEAASHDTVAHRRGFGG